MIFQGHRSIKLLWLEISCPHQIKLKPHWIVQYIKFVMYVSSFLMMYSWEIIDTFPQLKKYNIDIFMDTMKPTSFKLYMITTLLGIYIVILGLMTLTLFQGHKCVRMNISTANCMFLILVMCSLNMVWLLLKRSCTT